MRTFWLKRKGILLLTVLLISLAFVCDEPAASSSASPAEAACILFERCFQVTEVKCKEKVFLCFDDCEVEFTGFDSCPDAGFLFRYCDTWYATEERRDEAADIGGDCPLDDSLEEWVADTANFDWP